MSRVEGGPALDASVLRRRLGSQFIGNHIIVIEEIASTNDAALEFAAKGSLAGLVVFAEKQTAGRGQYGRHWESAAGCGLWFSILLRPRIALKESARLTTWLAGTIAATVKDETGAKAIVKSPNDIYIGGKKVAGVLVEMRAVPAGKHLAIAGVGINVSHQASDFPAELRSAATSLSMAVGRPIERLELAVALLRNLDQSYREFDF